MSKFWCMIYMHLMMKLIRSFFHSKSDRSWAFINCLLDQVARSFASLLAASSNVDLKFLPICACLSSNCCFDVWWAKQLILSFTSLTSCRFLNWYYVLANFGFSNFCSANFAFSKLELFLHSTQLMFRTIYKHIQAV